MKRAQSGEAERDILAAIRIALGREQDLVLWRVASGVGTSASGNTQRFGLVRGAADLIGILGPSGRFVALETKRARGGVVSPEQTLFLELVRAKGGFAAVVHSVPEAVDAINRARAGLSA